MSARGLNEQIGRGSGRAALGPLWMLAWRLALPLLLVCGCGSDDVDDAPPSVLQLSALHAEPDPVSGGRIVDAGGREVLLRGVNVNAFVDYWQYGDLPVTFTLSEADVEMMAAIGWNSVRLLLSWSRVEPQPGIYDDEYIEAARRAVTLFARHGIYSIIDLHQDAWGATLAAGPNEVCPQGREPAFGWDGAPGWATLDAGAPRCTVAGIRETSSAVLTSFAAFWDNAAPEPGGVGIRTRYVRMLGELAARFAHEPAVAGYDVMNEPNAFSVEQQNALAELYANALGEIRLREQDAGGFSHLVFFEPSALWSAFGNGPPPDFPRDDDTVYAPHIYTGGFDGGPITEAAFQTALDEARDFGGVPVLSGEWGADPRRADDSGDGYFLEHQRLQDQFRFGATLWTWRESCGDPHKAGDVGAGRIPFVWGEFDVDCTDNSVRGVRQSLVDQLTRAYVRAAPGQLVLTEYEPADGGFAADGDGAAAGSELVVFYPASGHGVPLLITSGLENAQLLPAPGGNLYITARTLGEAWSLRATPAQ